MAQNQTLAKNFEFKIVKDFAGYNSSRDKTNLAPEYMVRGSQNIFKKLSGTLATRPGLKRRGAADVTFSPVSSEWVWNTSWGATLPVWVTNSKLQVEFGGVWYTLLSGLTKTRYVFDKWWDNTEKKDRLLFVDGTDNLYSWSGGIANVASATVNTITKSTGTISWQQAGFSTTAGQKKIMIAGTEYTYTGGETTDTLTGVTPDPSSIPTTTIAIQSVVTTATKPASGFLTDFLKVINNQVYYGSYTSRLCYISSATDYADFTVPTPRAPGSPELLTLDGTLKGIGVRNGKAHIGYGSSSWAVISFTDITVGTTLTQKTTVDIKPVARLQAPYAHEFIASMGDSLYYLAQDQQVRTFGDFNNSFVPVYPSISLDISTELSGENFTGGQLKGIGEFMYLTAPTSGKVYLYQVRQGITVEGVAVAERFWHSPFTWNATCIDEIGGTVYVYSNSNPQLYQAWDTNQWYDDSPSDEHLPYTCVLALAYRDGGRRQGLISFDKLFTEGYLGGSAPLYCKINYNYLGSLAQTIATIDSSMLPAYRFVSGSSSLGDESLGDESLGDQATELGEDIGVQKTKTIASLPIYNCFEFQPIYYSDATDARWEILATGTNMEVEREQQASFIINKRR